jgi:hypothetical protein
MIPVGEGSEDRMTREGNSDGTPQETTIITDDTPEDSEEDAE